MRKFILVFLYLGLFSCALPVRSPTSKIIESRHLATEEDRTLSHFEETLLVGDSKGKLALIIIGPEPKKIDVVSNINDFPISVHSYHGKFYLLYRNGNFLILNPESGNIEKNIKLNLNLKEPSDFAFASDSQIYISMKKTSKILKVDLNSPTENISINLDSLRLKKGKIELHQLLLIGENLFVQVARFKTKYEQQQAALSVIDTTTNQLKKTIELAVKDPEMIMAAPGMNPEFPMIFDSHRNMLLLTLKSGEIPFQMGMIIRINLDTLEIYDFKKAISGSQGIIAFQKPFSKLFIIYHTSTPVTSSHLFLDLVDESGNLQRHEGALIDSFDGLNSLSINSKGTLIAMTNTCITGYCVNGAGVNFVEVATHSLLTKINSDFIGFQPSSVYFMN